MNKLDVFDDGHDIDMSDIQMELVASSLVSLLKHSGSSRAQLAGKLDCRRNRVTRILSGDENLTLRTISSVAEALGYAFDVVFYNKDYAKPKQPWHIDRLNKAVLAEPICSKPAIEMKVQDGKAVFNDLMEGNDADFYISVSKNFDINKIKSIQATENILSSKDNFHWDVNPSSSYSFISSLKDKEQWTTA